MNGTQVALATLLYPGILTAFVTGLLFQLVLRGRVGPVGGSALGTREGLATAASVVLTGLGLAMLPWPLHPVGRPVTWLWAWAAFELAALVPLLPPVMFGRPAVVRAAIREAQLGALARALLWAALVAALALHTTWRPGDLPAHVLALIAAFAALPAAIGWGPFSAEERVTPGGTGAGLPASGQSFDAWGRDLRAGALSAAVLVAALPVGVLPPWLGLPLVLVGLVLIAFLLRNFAGRLPRMALPAALSYCVLWLLPLAGAATLAVAIGERL